MYKIIDLSDKAIYKRLDIPGSINIPYDDLINNYKTFLNKQDMYGLYCKSGKLSKRASTVLNYLGYNTKVIEK